MSDSGTGFRQWSRCRTPSVDQDEAGLHEHIEVLRERIATRLYIDAVVTPRNAVWRAVLACDGKDHNRDHLPAPVVISVRHGRCGRKRLETRMNDDTRARLIGLNHIALEVGDVEAALEFYAEAFRFELRGSHENDAGRRVMAFLDMGDQFLALNEGRDQPPDDHRHIGLVVDDRDGVLGRVEAAGGTRVEGSSNNFRDPWGNRFELVEYRDVQFSKTPAVLRAMGVDAHKTTAAQTQLEEKNML